MTIPYLQFFVRKLSKEDIEEMNAYDPPTKEAWQMLHDYEPTMYRGTFEAALDRYNKAYEARDKTWTVRDFTVEKCCVTGDNDEDLRELELHEDFISWIGPKP